MKPEYQKALKEASFPELFMAHQKLAGRRNLAVFARVVVFVLVLWRDWSIWSRVVAAIIWFAAAGQHFHLKLIDNELRERKHESERKSERHDA